MTAEFHHVPARGRIFGWVGTSCGEAIERAAREIPHAAPQLHTPLVRPETHTGSLLSLTEVEITVGNLAAALSAQSTRTRGPRCSLGVLITTLDDTDRKALIAALDPSSGVEGSVIAAALRLEGHEIKGHTVRRHRNRECGCEHR